MIDLLAPLSGAALMSIAAALLGALCYLQKRLLISETLSHGCLPGVALASLWQAPYLGAFLSATTGYLLMGRLGRRRIKTDAALTAVLALFVGIGVLIASCVQFLDPLSFQGITLFFYGQAATLREIHVWIYGLLALFTSGMMLWYFQTLKIALFDPLFGKTVGLKIQGMNFFFAIALIALIAFGIRSLGVVLITGMLILPVSAARLATHQFSTFLLTSAAFGFFSALIGSAFSLVFPVLPIGPLITLAAGLFFACALVQERVRKFLRRRAYLRQCFLENLLKGLWKQKEGMALKGGRMRRALAVLEQKGLVARAQGRVVLTPKGVIEGARITRAHRLWELYLANTLAIQGRIIHLSASHIEHLISKELDASLTDLLGNPQKDPHNQPIPKASG